MKLRNFLFFLIILGTCYQGFSLSTPVKKYKDDLVAYYNFNQNQGTTLVDKLGRKNAGISGNRNFWTDNGVYGGAGYFNGSTSVVVSNVRNISNGRTLTIMMWVRPESIDGRSKLIAKRSYDTEFNYYLIGLDKGRPYIALGDGDELAVTPKNKILTVNNWHHIALTLYENSLKLFVDGALVEQVITTQDGFNSMNAKLSIGSDFEGEEGFFKGWIDDLYIFDEKLNPKDIMAEASRSDIISLKKVTKEIIIKNPLKFLVASIPIDDGRGSKIENQKNSLFSGVASKGMEAGWKDGFLKKTLFFNGKKDFISVPSYVGIDLTRSFSFLCWIKPETVKKNCVILFKGNRKNKNKFYSLEIKDGLLQGGFGDGNKFKKIASEVSLQEKTWQQVGLTFDLKTKICRLVLNGAFQADFSTTFSAVTGDAPLMIGAHPDIKKFFHGEIAGFKMFNVSLPGEVCRKFYRDTFDKVKYLDMKREKIAQIRLKLKTTFSRLRALNEILGEDDKIENVRGNEIQTLQKVEDLISLKTMAVEKKKKQKFQDFKIQKRDVLKQVEVLNKLLNNLNQKKYLIKLPVIDENSSINDLLKYSSKIYNLKAEVGLLIRNKQAEIKLKNSLLRKKNKRYENKIEKDIQEINEVNKDLGIPLLKINIDKLKADIVKYSAEIETLLHEKNKLKEDTILQLKNDIIKFRSEIKELQSELASLAILLNKPKHEDIDISSVLINNISRLKRIYEYEVKAIQQLKKKIKEYKVSEKTALSVHIRKLKRIISDIYVTDSNLQNVKKELGEPTVSPFKIPEEEVASIKSFKEISIKMKEYQSTLKKLKALHQGKINLLKEVRAKAIFVNNKKLKKQFEKAKVAIYKVNDQLGISEYWRIMKHDNDLNMENKELGVKIKEINRLVQKRTKTIKNKEAVKEKERSIMLASIKTVEKELSVAFKSLGKPDFVLPKFKSGEEKILLDKLKNELDKAKFQVEKMTKAKELKLKQNKVKWDSLMFELNELNKFLNLPLKKKIFNPETVATDFVSLKAEIARNKQKKKGVHDKIIAEISESVNKEKNNLATKVKKLSEAIIGGNKKLNQLNNKLGIKESKLKEFPWVKEEQRDLKGYYKFDEAGEIIPSVIQSGSLLFIDGYEKEMFKNGRYGKAPYFNGKNQYGELSLSSLEDSDITMLFWIKPAKRTNNQEIIQLTDAKRSYFISLNLKQSALSFVSFDNDDLYTHDLEGVLNINEWNHLAVVVNRKKKKIRIFKNGQFIWSYRIPLISNNFTTLFLGGTPRKKYNFSGVIDDFKIYGKVLESEFIYSGGLELENVSLKARVDFLENLKLSIDKDTGEKQKKLSKIETLKEQKLKEEEGLFKDQLKELNVILEKSGDVLQMESDYDLWDRDKRIEVVLSRIKRAKNHLEMQLAQEEAKRLKILEKIDKERKKLQNLYKKLGEEGDLFKSVPKTQEVQVLKKIKDIILEKERVYQRKLKDHKQKLEYINSEMDSIYKEINEITAKLKIPARKKPPIHKEREDDSLKEARIELQEMQKRWNAYEAKIESEYIKTSNEIEKIWESLLPVLNELNYKIKKPVYEIKNAKLVLLELEKLHKQKNKEWKMLKQKKAAIYERRKKELREMYAALKEISAKMGEKVIYRADFTESGISQSLKECAVLVKTRTEQLKNKLDKEEKERQSVIQSLIEEVKSKSLQFLEVNKELQLSEPLSEIKLLQHKPKGLMKYYLFDIIEDNHVFDVEISAPIKLINVKNTIRGDSKFPYSLIFNGMTSYAELQLHQRKFMDAFIGCRLIFRPKKLWKNKSILYYQTGPESGVDLFLNGKLLTLRKIMKGQKIAVSGGISVRENQTVAVNVDFDLVNNLIRFSSGGRIISETKLFSSYVFNGLLRFGSFNGKEDFFDGEIMELKLTQGILNQVEQKAVNELNTQKRSQDAVLLLQKRKEELTSLLKIKISSINQIKAEKKKKRETFLKKIDVLKHRLAELTGKEKIVFSVVIGKEEAALSKLQQKVKLAEIEKNRQEKEKSLHLTQVLNKIENREGVLQKLITQVGSDLSLKTMEKGKEQLYLKELETAIKHLEKEKVDKEIKIKKLTNSLKRLYLQYGTAEKQISFPSGKSLSLHAHIQELNKRIDVIKNKIKLKERDLLKAEWQRLFTKYQELSHRTNTPLESLEMGSTGKDIRKSMRVLILKITSLEKIFKKLVAEKKERILELKNEFEQQLSKLKPVLHELGEGKLAVTFDQKNPEQSLLDIKKLFKSKIRDLKLKKKREEDQINQRKKSVESLIKAIEEEKVKIKSLVKELDIKDYDMPTILETEGMIKGLESYYQFDSLQNKTLIDSLGNVSNSFVSSFTKDCKVVGKFGFAVNLNGFDQFISIPMNDTMTSVKEMSFSFWLYANRAYGKRNIVSCFSKDKKSGLNLFLLDGNVIVNLHSAGKIFTIKDDIQIERKKWTHLFCSIGNGSMELYLDGVKKGASQISKVNLSFLKYNFRIGSAYDQLIDLLSGKIDEFKVFSRKVGGNQAKEVMNAIQIQTEIKDVDLLQEEYAVLREETLKFTDQIKGMIEESEKIRLAKMIEINHLIENISQINLQMEESSFEFLVTSGSEDTAVEELKNILKDKQMQIKLFQAKEAKRKEEFFIKAKSLEESIRELHAKLDIEKEYTIVPSSMEKEDVTLGRAREYLASLQAQYQVFEKDQLEETSLNIQQDIYDYIFKINDIYEQIGKEQLKLSQFKEKDKKLLLVELKDRLVRAKSDFKSYMKSKQSESEKVLRKNIIKDCRVFARKIETLQNKLNIEDFSLDKKMDPNVRVYLNFDEGKGTFVKDRTIYGNRGVFINQDFDWLDMGYYNKCVGFTGQGEGFKIFNSSSLNEIGSFSMLFWLNLGNISKNSNIFSIGNKNNSKLSLNLRDQILVVGIGKDILIDTGIFLKEDSWQHLAIVFKQSEKLISIYLDGILASDIEYTKEVATSMFLNNNILIAADIGEQHFRGFIDELKLFSKVLSLDDIKANSKEGIPRIDTFLDNCTFQQAKDYKLELEQKFVKLSNQFEKHSKIEEEKKRNWEEVSKIFEEASLKKNILLIKDTINEINQLRKVINEPALTYKEPLAGEGQDVLAETKVLLNETLARVNKGLAIKPIIKKYPFNEKFDKREKLTCALNFEKYNGDILVDSSMAKQDVHFSTQVEKWIKDGIKGNALMVGDYGYIKIFMNGRVPYKLRQAAQIWLNPEILSTANTPVFTRGNFQLIINNGILQARIGDEIINFVELGQLPAKAWTLVNLNINEFSSKIQLGLGRDIGIAKSFSSRLINFQGPVYIGGAPENPKRFIGLIGEVLLFNRLLHYEDYESSVIYNTVIDGDFSQQSLNTVIINLGARNVEFMRIYQKGRISESSWEKFRNMKLLSVRKNKDRARHVTIVAELKTGNSDDITELNVEIPIPEFDNIKLILPPESSQLTVR